MKLPEKRNSKQSIEARKVLDKENEGTFLLRIDKGLRMQFNLTAQFKNTSMNAVLIEYINEYVGENFNEAEKGIINLKEQSERR